MQFKGWKVGLRKIAVALLGANVPAAVAQQEKAGNPGLSRSLATIQGKEAPARSERRANRAQGLSCLAVVQVVQETVHHHDVEGSVAARCRIVEQPKVKPTSAAES